MTPHTDLVHGGWWQSGTGIVMSAWAWLAGDANGLTIILTLLTIVLTTIKVIDAVRRWRRTSGATLIEHMQEATRPGDL